MCLNNYSIISTTLVLKPRGMELLRQSFRQWTFWDKVLGDTKWSNIGLVFKKLLNFFDKMGSKTPSDGPFETKF